MNNKQIASKFDLLAKLMELHDENPFKIRSYANAYLSLRKLEGDLTVMPKDELSAIPGVGNTIADKISELITTGEMKTLNKYLELTPIGIQEMLSIKGLGPKKVNQIWKEMEIDTIGELLYACNENRLVAFKGFGIKLQEEIKQKVEYFVDSRGKFLYAYVHKAAEELETFLRQKYSGYRISICGDVRRMMPEVCGIELLTDMPDDMISIDHIDFNNEDGRHTFKGLPVFTYHVTSDNFSKELYKRSCSEEFFSAFDPDLISGENESQIFYNLGINFIPPECRENQDIIQHFRDNRPDLIKVEDIRGIVHNHSTYSDGLHSLRDMADYVHVSGFEYFVISDHSKSAGYAGGLTEDQLVMQWKEIDDLNKKYSDGFQIFKSIESDILSDGSLDYPDEILSQFDLVIASVHSVLNMDEPKATARLIKAIENPYTKILGHPSGRLLLARPGYPIDNKKVIDACAQNGVVIELNANPQRLDIDWTWIPYIMEKNVLVAINPDAHSKESIHYIRYGVSAGRKGGLTKNMCLNTKNKTEFLAWMNR